MSRRLIRIYGVWGAGAYCCKIFRCGGSMAPRLRGPQTHGRVLQNLGWGFGEILCSRESCSSRLWVSSALDSQFLKGQEISVLEFIMNGARAIKHACDVDVSEGLADVGKCALIERAHVLAQHIHLVLCCVICVYTTCVVYT